MSRSRPCFAFEYHLRRCVCAAARVALLLFGPVVVGHDVAWAEPPVAKEPGSVADAHWCAPELTRVNDRVCYFSPVEAEADSETKGINDATLVIFLHSLVGGEPMAAWDQQRRMQKMARTYGFTMLVPRGRPGLGPGRNPSVVAWPTAQATQELFEGELIAEWKAAIAWASERHGQFRRTFIFGFSNGAYYATSLAFRERFPVDGVAVFAGGSGSKYQRISAARAKVRTPLFVGYGTLDPDHPQQQQLVQLLRSLRWPHASLQAKVGHTVAGAQLSAALRYLGHPATQLR